MASPTTEIPTPATPETGVDARGVADGSAPGIVARARRKIDRMGEVEVPALRETRPQ